jgi:vacuolar protein sorting-associated protein 18
MKHSQGGSSGPAFFYDPKYALWLCLKEKRMRACVRIYSMMSMHEEAVALALKVLFNFTNCRHDDMYDSPNIFFICW